MKLGLDISTTTTGYAILTYDNKLESIGYIDLKKIEGLYNKVDYLFDELKRIISQYNIGQVNIEDPMGNFSFGKTNRLTMNMLSNFNSIISYRINRELGLKINHINVNKARKQIGYSNTKEMKLLKKESGDKNFTKNKILELCIVFEPELEKIKEYNKNGKLNDNVFDRSDAYVMARFKE
jgi:Holliday junction resolvasome RuvABC endonuclease subunit